MQIHTYALAPKIDIRCVHARSHIHGIVYKHHYRARKRGQTPILLLEPLLLRWGQVSAANGFTVPAAGIDIFQQLYDVYIYTTQNPSSAQRRLTSEAILALGVLDLEFRQ